MEDSKIIELFFKRDERAIEQTKAMHGMKLWRFAFGILKNAEDAEECESDTYLRAWETIPPQKPKYFYAYLAKLCRFLAFDKLDWKNAQKRNAEIVELTAEMEMCIPDHTQKRCQEGKEIGDLLNNFLAKLPKESRLIFMRRYWFADSIHEISTKYGMTESKVKTSLFRTRKKLRSYLESEGIL